VWQWTEEFIDEHARAGILGGDEYYQPQGSIWYFPSPYKLDEHGKLLLTAPGLDRSGGIGSAASVIRVTIRIRIRTEFVIEAELLASLLSVYRSFSLLLPVLISLPGNVSLLGNVAGPYQGSNPYSLTPIGVPTKTLPLTISGVANLLTGV
jgi:hypothetical protein